VVGDDIEDLTQAEFGETGTETLVGFFASQFGIDALVIDNVVTVHAAWSGLQVWRAINVRDSERFEIRSDPNGVVERKASVQLQAVCRVWNSGHCFLICFG